MSTPANVTPVRQWRDVLLRDGDLPLAVAAWLPLEPQAIALVSHGHSEHLGRYGHIINRLVEDGFAVYGIDHRAHGRSADRSKLIQHLDAAARDLHVVARMARERHDGLPTALIGHSMGGLIALRYTLRYQDTLAALVTSGPAVVIDHGTPPAATRVARLAGRLAPWAPLPGRGGGGCSLSVDVELCRQFERDHRTIGGAVRLGTAAAMLDAGEDTRARLGEITVPILAMHGADDTLTHPDGTRLIDARVASEDKTVIFWEGMRHEIFNETGRDEVIATLRGWLAERFG